MDVTKQQVSNGKTSNTTAGSKQQHSSAGGLSTTPTTAGGGSGRSGGGGGSGSHLGECPEGGTSASGTSFQRQLSNGRSSKQGQHNNMSLNLSLSNGTTGVTSSSKTPKNCLSNGVDTAKVFIKKEPDSFESGGQNRHCNRSPTTTSASGRRLSLNGKDSKRSQRMSTSQKPSSDKLMRSFSMSDDLEDDLKLSAADCMGGVISTPPIKPLEEGDDMITTPSPPTSAGVLGSSKSGGSSRSGSAAVENTNISGASTTNHVTASTTTSAGKVTSPNTSISQAEMNKKVGLMPPSANVKDNASLMQELDDFSKIMDEVAMEQRANEERLVLNQPPNVFHRPSHAHGTQSHDMVATAHVPRPTHLISPPPYYAATAPKPGPSQQYYNHPAGQPPSYATTPHGGSSVQDPSIYIGVDYRQSLSQQHMTPTHVDPATFAPRPDQLHSQQRHPQLQHISASAVSPQVHQQPPSLGGGQSRSILVSPTVRGMSLPHTPISSHLPPFPDPAVSSVTTPTMPPPHTPTTPLEHFNSTFPAAPPHQQQQQPPPNPTPPSQLHSPTHPQYVPAAPPPPQAGTVPISSTAFPFSSHLRSPTVTSAGFNWQPNAAANSSLRDQMLAQVTSHIEARIGGQKRLSQDAGFSIPPPTKMVAVAVGPSPYPPQISHMTLQPQTPTQQQQQQSQQYLPSGAPPTAPPTGSIAAASYTGLSQQQQQLVHTISYQGQGRMTSAPGYPHHHI